MLALAYWLHQLATVLWIGGLTALGLLPALRRAVLRQAKDPTEAGHLEQRNLRLLRLNLILSLLILALTALARAS